ncbi:LysM domain-containing protein [Paucibacter sp. R3-3]|uniref:LysM domain-containing protein n=1 Tax=Roseateles agri TaxID=3098619 RepID=A0ABU5DAL9_9BURK|nr:LysM domain-containing protein [Paucibacter sp. R3-3]MDY0743299.1 LysM domain-containing protein [Paucibacter sp. R3-3]
MMLLRLSLSLGLAGLLISCAQGPVNHAPPAPPTPTTPKSEPPPEPAAPDPGPVPVLSPQQAAKFAMSAVSLLEQGKEAEAREDIQRALAAEPSNKLAQSLLRQISVDPVATLGKESFSYTVRPNDSLSSIAGRFMGDIYSFYILARYNNISVPKQLAGGQVLRIPGKAPPPLPATVTPAPAPTLVAAPAPVAPVPAPNPGEVSMKAGEAAERAGNLTRAYAEYLKAASLDQPGADAKAEQVRGKLVTSLSRGARTAFAKQDLDGAIKAWDQVLVVDPGNDTAKLERQRAVSLKQKLSGK